MKHLLRRTLLLACGIAFFCSIPQPATAAPDATDHWAFQPLRPSRIPSVRNPTWPRTEIDAFILARLEAAKLQPAPPADARTLLRRLSFDLTGLPPTPAEVESFETEIRQDRDVAVARCVDRLLASNAYGERWGRHWLDVARYSDTKGYVYDREERRFIHAPAYRDWVINAFNTDLPYDRFLQPEPGADGGWSAVNQQSGVPAGGGP